MTPNVNMKVIKPDDLYHECAALKCENYRLVQIGCTKTSEGFEINYSFDKDYEFLNLRVAYTPGDTIKSIQTVYGCAFIYENEISELFDIQIKDMAVDFKGNLYKISTHAPFSGNESKQEDKL